MFIFFSSIRKKTTMPRALKLKNALRHDAAPGVLLYGEFSDKRNIALPLLAALGSITFLAAV
jgi:hypothetical protein